ncbi:unnamed protein product [Cuscuta campestris]|uniref:Uncharacterized protein n=1 Tax=Cuscuta campestris TaxID=132261 RepID=A0A484LFF4_9ASTE|nr:unnamed protein product [Cuscuta campestris]
MAILEAPFGGGVPSAAGCSAGEFPAGTAAGAGLDGMVGEGDEGAGADDAGDGVGAVVGAGDGGIGGGAAVVGAGAGTAVGEILGEGTGACARHEAAKRAKRRNGLKLILKSSFFLGEKGDGEENMKDNCVRKYIKKMR